MVRIRPQHVAKRGHNRLRSGILAVVGGYFGIRRPGKPVRPKKQKRGKKKIIRTKSRTTKRTKRHKKRKTPCARIAERPIVQRSPDGVIVFPGTRKEQSTLSSFLSIFTGQSGVRLLALLKKLAATPVEDIVRFKKETPKGKVLPARNRDKEAPETSAPRMDHVLQADEWVGKVTPAKKEAEISPSEDAIGALLEEMEKEGHFTIKKNKGAKESTANEKGREPKVKIEFVGEDRDESGVEAKGDVEEKKEEKPKEKPKVDSRNDEHGKGVIETLRISTRKRDFKTALRSLNHIGLGRERHLFIANFAVMLNAGLPVVDSLKTLQTETRSRPMKKIIGRIRDSVENGNALWRAMEDEFFFSPYAIALVRIGEEAGSLSENMQYLFEQQEKDEGLRRKVRMAMIYPTIVLVLMLAIVMGLGLFVLPNLIQVLFSLNVKLPLVTRLLIQFTNLFTAYARYVVPGVIGGVILFALLVKFTRFFRMIFQWGVFHTPGIGRLAREATIAQFGVMLGGLLRAGVPLVDSMHSLAEVSSTVTYQKFYFRLLKHVSLGNSFAKSFELIRATRRLLPPTVQQLIVTGEQSGSLSDIMLKIADIYEKKAADTAEKLPVILEPMLLLIIGGLVATIAIAVIMPIYSIVGSVGR